MSIYDSIYDEVVIRDLPEDAIRDGHLTIPDGVRAISGGNFPGFDKIEKITIPDSVASIAWGMFGKTQWYKDQPDGLIYAGKVAYEWKGEMPEGTRIVLREGTTGIAGGAFGMLDNLVGVTLPEGIKFIGNMAFLDCKNLIDINFPESIEYVESIALEGTAWYESQPDGLVYIGNVAYAYKGKYPLGAHIEVRYGTTAITEALFVYADKCKRLKKVAIPKSVTYIGEDIFNDLLYDLRSRVTVYCDSGSCAEEYAKKHKMKFETYEGKF